MFSIFIPVPKKGSTKECSGYRTTALVLHASKGKQWKQWLTLFFWAPKSLQMVTAAMKLKDTYSMEGKL